MSDEKTARDPYVGMRQYIRQQAQSQIVSPLTVGEVLSVKPLRVRADGLDLDANDIKISQLLVSGLDEEVLAKLPNAVYMGECSCGNGAGKCKVTRPAQTEEQAVARKTALQVHDELLLLKSDDGQTYYAVCRMLEVRE